METHHVLPRCKTFAPLCRACLVLLNAFHGQQCHLYAKLNILNFVRVVFEIFFYIHRAQRHRLSFIM